MGTGTSGAEFDILDHLYGEPAPRGAILAHSLKARVARGANRVSRTTGTRQTVIVVPDGAELWRRINYAIHRLGGGIHIDPEGDSFRVTRHDETTHESVEDDKTVYYTVKHTSRERRFPGGRVLVNVCRQSVNPKGALSPSAPPTRT